jgi:hypothetical protein
MAQEPVHHAAGRAEEGRRGNVHTKQVRSAELFVTEEQLTI